VLLKGIRTFVASSLQNFFMQITTGVSTKSVSQTLRLFFTNRRALFIGLVFATDSMLFGSWVTRIPFVKDQLGVNDAELGLLLFLMPIGSILANPFTAKIVSTFQAAKVCSWTASGFFLSCLIPANASTIYMVGLGIFMMGAFTAILNVAMNTLVTNLEQESGMRIMAACHGMWSLGGMIGSATAALFIWAEVSTGYHLTIIVLFLLLTTYLIYPTIASIPEQKGLDQTSFVKPSRNLLILIFIGLTVSMGEGVCFDWSALYLREIAKAPSSISALGFSFFAMAMTVGRFAGDTIIPRFGERRLLAAGGLLASFGVAIMLIIPNTTVSVLGFLILGMGCSLGAPILYSISMRQPGIPPAAGLATYATFSFLGFMAGPPVVGFIAEAYSLPLGFALVGLLLLFGAVTTRAVKL
jgi:MFS family permease